MESEDELKKDNELLSTKQLAVAAILKSLDLTTSFQCRTCLHRGAASTLSALVVLLQVESAQ